MGVDTPDCSTVLGMAFNEPHHCITAAERCMRPSGTGFDAGRTPPIRASRLALSRSMSAFKLFSVAARGEVTGVTRADTLPA